MSYELHHADCADIIDAMNRRVRLTLSDPPYGIGANKMQLGNGMNKIYRGETDWDILPEDEMFKKIVSIADFSILWGGNFFANLMPASRCWLVWDKRTGANSYADCELAWTNIDSVVKMFTVPWVGANAKDTVERLHPTQKPIVLMEWCISLCTKPGDVIFDPYMGSGTTGVAAIRTGRNFIGIEKDAAYYAIAQRRCAEASLQPALFQLDAAPTEEQAALL